MKIQILEGSFQSLKAENEYTLIFGINGTMAYLISIEEMSDAFRNIYRALKPKGYFIVDLSNFYGLIKNYRHQEPTEIIDDDKKYYFQTEYIIDLENSIWGHRMRVFVENDGKISTFNDVHELALISPRELLLHAKSNNLKLIHHLQSFEDRPNERKSGTRIVMIFQK